MAAAAQKVGTSEKALETYAVRNPKRCGFRAYLHLKITNLTREMFNDLRMKVDFVALSKI